MRSATQHFNRFASKRGNPEMKIIPYIYYKKGNQRSSNKAFKLLNILRMIKQKDIEQFLARILHHNFCVLGSLDENNDMNITVNYDRAVNILNDT